jgi:DNA polymerase I
MKINYGIEHLPLLEGAELVAFDCETTGLQPVEGGLRLLQLGVDGEFPVVIDCWELDDPGWLALDRFFGTKRRWVAHNAQFDLGWLQAHELYPEGEVYCTMLASRVLTSGLPNIKNSLQAVALRYLGETVDKEEQRSDWSVPVLRREQLEYAANDVRLLLDLWGPMTQRLETGDLTKAWALECKALPAVAQMWRTGLPFCKESLEALRNDLNERQETMSSEFITELDAALPQEHKLPRDPDGSINLRTKATGSVRAGDKRPAGFNVNSPHQLKAVFSVLLGEVPVDADGKPSASRAALREYAADHAVVAKYLQWKRVEKRRQMVEALLKHQDPDGFIRASYLQLGADTGRMSCMSPNCYADPARHLLQVVRQGARWVGAGGRGLCADGAAAWRRPRPDDATHGVGRSKQGVGPAHASRPRALYGMDDAYEAADACGAEVHAAEWPSQRGVRSSVRVWSQGAAVLRRRHGHPNDH